MAEIQWIPEMSVGVEEFDFHHKQIFSIINELREVNEKESNTEELKELLKQLVDYAEFHLESEEEQFEKYNYPKGPQHTSLHNSYREKINNFIEREPDQEMIQELVSFLEDWWVSHIQTEDKKYTDFFHKNNVY